MGRPELPPDVELVRTTEKFANDNVPTGLLRAHRVGSGVWGRLVVHSGSLRFVFDDDRNHPIVVDVSRPMVIPPGRVHHVEIREAVTFAVEFYRTVNTSESSDTDKIVRPS